ncbi:uncharacterized protein PV09_00773 [Verruconis gallopava]|uniref:N-acetyltransferase domain-containing protein n=1 Tax=Verruconis gallopava TaxID=253628 RepID=A0A0D1Z7A7_9PEZI|nr:uncharacterized protein PV09_00773 [Verruconis gallopava]KIW08847.1 hypothetical protein PV09_00773 [Verruconis gallopava]
MSSEPTIRLARREDVPEILAMIKELAAFEKAEDSVQATEESLAETLCFDTSSDGVFPTKATGYAKTFILTAPEGEVAGMALWFHNYSTWTSKPGIYLEDLFVRPKFRRRGYATLLLRELAKEVTRINGGRLEWWCLKWNQRALNFYEGIGAKQMDEWIPLRVDGENLPKLAAMEVKVKAGSL